jgi:hypothetical protein
VNRAERRRQRKMMSVAQPGQKRRKIWLALPCYGATVTVATMRSLMHDMWRLVARGDEVKIFDEVGHADIYSLRAQIVSHFLSDPDATDLVMIDNDVAWDALGLIKLVDHDVDLAAASYPKRDYPITFMYRSDGGPLMGDAATGLVEVWGMPGGFMKMSRAMLERMADHYRGELGIFDHMVPSQRTVRMFDPYWWTDEQGNRRVLSEDYAFCQRWRDIGGKVYMDVSIPMAHIGTHAFKGCLGAWLDDKKEEQAA